MPVLRQASFAGGEVAPGLWGRTDVERYASSLRRCRNFLPTPLGALVARPGMWSCGGTKSSATAARLVPFIYSESTAYVLEVGHLYVRVWQEGARLAVEVATPFTEAELPRLKYTQQGDVVTFVHPSHAPQHLMRLSHTSWTLVAEDFSVRAAYFPNHRPGLADTGTLFTEDATHPKREWRWAVTTIGVTTDGQLFESLPFYVTESVVVGEGETRTFTALPANNEVVLYLDKPLVVTWHTNISTTPPDGFLVRGWRVYRGRSDLFGLVGETQYMRYVDVGGEPDYSRGPPQGRNPFEVRNGAGTLLRTENPATVGYFAQRRLYANTAERPATFFASRVGDYSNFDAHSPGLADDAVEFELASRRREEVRSLLPLQQLLLFTNGSVWAASPFAYGEVPEVLVQSEVGASWLEPQVVGSDVLYVRAKSAGVQRLAYANERGGWTGGDVSLLASHLFRGHTVVDWAYCEAPHSVLWLVREDGLLLSLTYQPEQQVWAWAWHDTHGTVEAVCSVPEGEEDVLYLVVVREGLRGLERLASTNTVGEVVHLDGAIAFSGDPSGLGALVRFEGQEVWALVDGVPMGPFTVQGWNIQLNLTSTPSRVHVGYRYTPEAETLDMGDAKLREKLLARVGFEVEEASGLEVGASLDTLEKWRQRTVADSYGAVPPFTGDVTVAVRSGWAKGGRAALRVTVPLPCTVLAVLREVEVAGR